MKTEVKNDNCLIAEFMGIKEQQGFYDSYGRDEPFWFTSNELYRTESRSLPDLSMEQFKEEAKYHRSWDWLMPVVEKIEKLGYDFDIQSSLGDQFAVIHTTTDIIVDTDKGAESVSVPKIEAVYKAVVEFIRWYNQQTTSNPEQS